MAEVRWIGGLGLGNEEVRRSAVPSCYVSGVGSDIQSCSVGDLGSDASNLARTSNLTRSQMPDGTSNLARVRTSDFARSQTSDRTSNLAWSQTSVGTSNLARSETSDGTSHLARSQTSDGTSNLARSQTSDGTSNLDCHMHQSGCSFLVSPPPDTAPSLPALDAASLSPTQPALSNAATAGQPAPALWPRVRGGGVSCAAHGHHGTHPGMYIFDYFHRRLRLVAPSLPLPHATLHTFPPHFPQPLSITLRGVTNDAVDPSVDVFRTVTLPLLKKLGIEEGLELKVCAAGRVGQLRRGVGHSSGGRCEGCGGMYSLLQYKISSTQQRHLPVIRRGARPLGGGEVQLRVPNLRSLPAVDLTDEGMIKRVRGVSYSMKVWVEGGVWMQGVECGVWVPLLTR
eukprot:358298-Chlamydomonas_euryale.AAC.3